MTHRVKEDASPQKRGGIFQEKYLPHWAMGIITTIWLFFQLLGGETGAPPTINQGFAAVLALWSSYCFNQRAEAKASKEKKDE